MVELTNQSSDEVDVSLRELVIGTTNSFSMLLLDYLDFGEARAVGYLCDIWVWFPERKGSEDSFSVTAQGDEELVEQQDPNSVTVYTGIEIEKSPYRVIDKRKCVIGQEAFYKCMIERLLQRSPNLRNNILSDRLDDLLHQLANIDSTQASVDEVTYPKKSASFRSRFYSSLVFDSFCHSCYHELNQIQKTHLSSRSIHNLRERLRQFIRDRCALKESLIQQNIKECTTDNESESEDDSKIMESSVSSLPLDEPIQKFRSQFLDNVDEGLDLSRQFGGSLFYQKLFTEYKDSVLDHLPPCLYHQLKRDPKVPRVSFPVCANCEFELVQPEEAPEYGTEDVVQMLPRLRDLTGQDNLHRTFWFDDSDGSVSAVSFPRHIVVDRIPNALRDYIRLFDDDRHLVTALSLPYIKGHGLVEVANIESIGVGGDMNVNHLLKNIIESPPEFPSSGDDILKDPFRMKFKSMVSNGGLTMNSFDLVIALRLYKKCRENIMSYLHGRMSFILAQYLGPSFVISHASQIIRLQDKHDFRKLSGGNRLIHSVSLYVKNDFDIITLGGSALPPAYLFEDSEFSKLVQVVSMGGANTITASELFSPVIRPLPIYEVLKSIRRIVDTFSRMKLIVEHPAYKYYHNQIHQYLRVFRVVDEVSLSRDYLTLVENILKLDRVPEKFTEEFIDLYIDRRLSNNEDGPPMPQDGSEDPLICEENNDSYIPPSVPENRSGVHYGDEVDYQRIDELFRVYCARAPVSYFGTEKGYLHELEILYKNEIEEEKRRINLHEAQRHGIDITSYL
eukprot:GHVH01004321.1.p1 GENE.GHVH01004321.1~~GHVH01004321.1.p1  ORF type:complete len:801 (-),score=116.75 GHVH01004321.1:28-2394(-)